METGPVPTKFSYRTVSVTVSNRPCTDPYARWCGSPYADQVDYPRRGHLPKAGPRSLVNTVGASPIFRKPSETAALLHQHPFCRIEPTKARAIV